MLYSFVTAVALFSGAALAATGELGDAAITTDNVAGASYQAVLPNKNTTTIRGQITGTSNTNGTGVEFNINFYGLPDQSQGGPFIYHIHALPVPSDGNCTGTLAHLDPYIRGETPVCDATQPETCQVGDLSGKHGNITRNPFQTAYLDLYTTTTKGIGAFFGNRSIVIHSANKTRLTCANFTLVSSGSPSTNASSTTSSTTSASTYTGGATSMAISAGTLVAAILGLLNLLM
ncbi:putative superoxide dismutase [Phaeomoniella chlamydospora]|uniref:superoxide dismutase n=1 Tax=Phaeomoniella chlamydospora TaxID=158046 RepID=A0A0G2F1F0_PHACM|nr:putative superoxide dismutase [Phaeomoniella chlamydospora]